MQGMMEKGGGKNIKYKMVNTKKKPMKQRISRTKYTMIPVILFAIRHVYYS